MNAETNPFELRAGTIDTSALQALSFRGRERINDVYWYEVVFTTSLPPKSLVAVFGDAAALTFKTSGRSLRIIQGIVAHLEALGGVPGERETGRRRYSLTIVPKLWLLKHRRKNRVFQNKMPKEIVESLLRGIGIPVEEWRWRTQPDYPKLPFVYQRNESDYDFFRRVLASAGIFFYFEHPSKDGAVTKLNFGDGAGHTVAVQGSLRFDDGTGADAEEERIYEFGLKKRLRPKALRMLDRDVEKAINWSRVATTKPTSDPVFDTDTKKITPDILREEVYQVDGALRVGPDAEMDVELERLRSGYLEARGRSDCRQLAPGYRFQLGSHPIGALNDTYTVTALDAEGIHPAFMGKGDATHVYRNRFRCIPFRFSPRPLRSKRRPKMGLEVAKVVGMQGQLVGPTVEANHCGYVRIRFRWDIADDRGTPKESYGINEDPDHVVRLPVVQPWAGAGYGAQFIPRQGMEVLVGFLEHQGERPIILGCISSEENMPPWSGDENDFQKVGIHSRSWPPGGDGWSEISIDDRKGDELIYVQAQKDLREYVKHDVRIVIENDRATSILGDESHTVNGSQVEEIVQDHARTVQGSVYEQVNKDQSCTVQGNVSEEVNKEVVIHVDESVSAYSKAETEVISDKEIALLSGKSAVVIKPDEIVLVSPKITVASEGAKLTLVNNATLEGSSVQLKAGSGASVEPRKPKKVCRFELGSLSWKSDIDVRRATETIKAPHWEKAKQDEVREENNPNEQHYPFGSKKPAAYLFKGKGKDELEVKIKVHDQDDLSGDLLLRGSLPGENEPLRFEGKFAPAAETTVTLKITNLPDNLQHYEGNSFWEVVEQSGKKRHFKVAEWPRLEVFVVHDKPPSFYKNGVQVEAMRLMFKKAEVSGLSQSDKISARVTTYCHTTHGMTYDTVGGASCFGVSGRGGIFQLMDYIKKNSPSAPMLSPPRTPNTVNCYDQAAAVQAFSGCLGVPVKWLFVQPFGYINETNLIGVGQCNNPFYMWNGTSPMILANDSKRTSFGNHAFVETIPPPGQYIRDACAGPHNTTENLGEYLRSAIDSGFSDISKCKWYACPGLSSVS